MPMPVDHDRLKNAADELEDRGWPKSARDVRAASAELESLRSQLAAVTAERDRHLAGAESYRAEIREARGLLGLQAGGVGRTWVGELSSKLATLERDLMRALEERDEARGRIREIAAAWRERGVVLESGLEEKP